MRHKFKDTRKHVRIQTKITSLQANLKGFTLFRSERFYARELRLRCCEVTINGTDGRARGLGFWNCKITNAAEAILDEKSTPNRDKIQRQKEKELAWINREEIRVEQPLS